MPITESTDPSWISEASTHRRSSSMQDISGPLRSSTKSKALSALRLISLRRWRIVSPLLTLSLGSYMATLVAFAYFPNATSRILTGSINVAYALALTQFVVTFAVAVLYSAMAARWVDPLTADAHALCAELADGGHDD